MASQQNERLWNTDLLQIIRAAIGERFPDYKVENTKVLKDVFLYNDKKWGNNLQFGFVDQDVVLYKETLDLSGFKAIPSVFLHNVPTDRYQMVLPKIILELKYNGVNSHGLITYSKYAADIKSIFPDCTYIMVMRYQNGSTENKLLRHGTNIDKIIFLQESKAQEKYVQGDFEKELNRNLALRQRYQDLLQEILTTLQQKETSFAK